MYEPFVILVFYNNCLVSFFSPGVHAVVLIEAALWSEVFSSDLTL